MTWADPDFFHSNSKVSTYFKWREINWSMCFSWHLFNLTVHLHRGVERGNFASTPATAGNGTPETLSKTDHAPSLQNSAFCLQLPTGNLIKDLTISACSFYASAWHNGALKKPFHRTAFCAMDTIKHVPEPVTSPVHNLKGLLAQDWIRWATCPIIAEPPRNDLQNVAEIYIHLNFCQNCPQISTVSFFF